MRDYTDLVMRLRSVKDTWQSEEEQWMLEAADAIEELSMKLHGDEAAIAGMKREIERMVVSDKPRTIAVQNAIDDMPTVDAVPVVRCKDCTNYVESEEANGEKMCVRDADWCVEDGCYYGFTEYPSPDWFCADGERRSMDGGDE